MSTARFRVAQLLDNYEDELEVSGAVDLESTKLGGETIEFPDPFTFTARLSHAGRGIIVRGETEGPVRLRCGRCLEQFAFVLKASFEELAVFVVDDEEADEDFAVIEEQIDLAPIIYQSVMLELPMRPLCREACAGICAGCGKNLNDEPHVHQEAQVDERLAPLMEFYKREGGKKT